MPRVSEPAGWRVPGVYAALVPFEPSGKRPDPRLYLGCDAEELARLDALKAEADAEDAMLRAAAVDRGEPFTCPAWRVGGRSFPSLPPEHPLRARDGKAIRVFSDDRVMPVYDG